MADKKKVELGVKSTAQVDAEARLSDDYTSPVAKVPSTRNPDETDDSGGFVGVDSVYQNAANKTDKPRGKKPAGPFAGATASEPEPEPESEPKSENKS